MGTTCFTAFLFWDFRMSRSFKPYFYLIDENIEEWTPTSGKIKNINYNLSFECDLLIIENSIDYFAHVDGDEDEEDEEVIRNYSLSTPFTIDLNINKKRSCESSESTPLLSI